MTLFKTKKLFPRTKNLNQKREATMARKMISMFLAAIMATISIPALAGCPEAVKDTLMDDDSSSYAKFMACDEDDCACKENLVPNLLLANITEKCDLKSQFHIDLNDPNCPNLANIKPAKKPEPPKPANFGDNFKPEELSLLFPKEAEYRDLLENLLWLGVWGNDSAMSLDEFAKKKLCSGNCKTALKPFPEKYGEAREKWVKKYGPRLAQLRKERRDFFLAAGCNEITDSVPLEKVNAKIEKSNRKLNELNEDKKGNKVFIKDTEAKIVRLKAEVSDLENNPPKTFTCNNRELPVLTKVHKMSTKYGLTTWNAEQRKTLQPLLGKLSAPNMTRTVEDRLGDASILLASLPGSVKKHQRSFASGKFGDYTPVANFKAIKKGQRNGLTSMEVSGYGTVQDIDSKDATILLDGHAKPIKVNIAELGKKFQIYHDPTWMAKSSTTLPPTCPTTTDKAVGSRLANSGASIGIGYTYIKGLPQTRNYYNQDTNIANSKFDVDIEGRWGYPFHLSDNLSLSLNFGAFLRITQATFQHEWSGGWNTVDRYGGGFLAEIDLNLYNWVAPFIGLKLSGAPFDVQGGFGLKVIGWKYLHGYVMFAIDYMMADAQSGTILGQPTRNDADLFGLGISVGLSVPF